MNLTLRMNNIQNLLTGSSIVALWTPLVPQFLCSFGGLIS